MTIKTDIAIIGSGPGGYVAALRAAQLGASCTIIEKDRLGGVCLNWGCIPTKALLYSAEVIESAHTASDFGIKIGDVVVDWDGVQAHKNSVVKKLTGGVEVLLKKAGVNILYGAASFIEPTILQVESESGTETVEARDVIIATGSRNASIPIPGLDGPGVVDSTGALALEALPNSICIIGAGAIGLEFASLFNDFGVKVTVVEMMPRIAPLMDEAISRGLDRALSGKGIDLRTNTRVSRVEHDGKQCTITMTKDGEEQKVTADIVLSAIGRAANIENIGLENLGIKADRKGIQVDNRMRTAVPHVYAIGDVAKDGPMLAHVASHQGIVAVEDAMGLTAHMAYNAVPSCIYTSPEAASVGLTEEEARNAGYEVVTGTFRLGANGKALAMGVSDGFVKVVSEAKNKAILGVHIVGPHASDVILEGTLSLDMEVTLDEMRHVIHPHPALGEALAEAMLDAEGISLHSVSRKRK